MDNKLFNIFGKNFIAKKKFLHKNKIFLVFKQLNVDKELFITEYISF